MPIMGDMLSERVFENGVTPRMFYMRSQGSSSQEGVVATSELLFQLRNGFGKRGSSPVRLMAEGDFGRGILNLSTFRRLSPV